MALSIYAGMITYIRIMDTLLWSDNEKIKIWVPIAAPPLSADGVISIDAYSIGPIKRIGFLREPTLVHDGEGVVFEEYEPIGVAVRVTKHPNYNLTGFAKDILYFKMLMSPGYHLPPSVTFVYEIYEKDMEGKALSVTRFEHLSFLPERKTILKIPNARQILKKSQSVDFTIKFYFAAYIYGSSTRLCGKKLWQLGEIDFALRKTSNEQVMMVSSPLIKRSGKKYIKDAAMLPKDECKFESYNPLTKHGYLQIRSASQN